MKKHKTEIKYPTGHDGSSHAKAQATVKSVRTLRFFASAVACIALTFAFANAASAQSLTWDNTRNNPFVLSGNGDQCTGYAWGRFKYLNGTALEFTEKYGRHGGRLTTLAVETPYVYRDVFPVRGSLISWSKGTDYGHTAIVEAANVDGKGGAKISEQNWPHDNGSREPWSPTLTAAQLKSRAGKTDYFTLVGYLNPNRPPAFGTAQLAKNNGALQLGVPLLEEDRRALNILVGIFDGGNVVSGTTGSGTINPNATLTVRWGNTSQLQSGRAYTVYLWATDFRGLRSVKGWTFTWQ